MAATDSRTLTNLYFGPNPAPAATVVGFDGSPQTLTAGFDLQLSNRAHWRGDFEFRVLDYRTDLSKGRQGKGLSAA